MGFMRNDFDKMDEQLKKITSQKVEEISINNRIPTVADLKDNNQSNLIDATILFIDIRKSTELTDMSLPKTMVKIYRSFIRMAVDCVRKNNGVTRQFLGDRIMGVFYDEIDVNGNILSSSVDNAINCARALQTCIIFSLNKNLKLNVCGKMISCGIGIDTGKVLVSKVGMHGLESNDNRENEMDCVWVSKVTNYASKYSDISNGNEIFISEKVYEKLSDCLKQNVEWNKVIRIKNNKKYIGYCVSDFYLDYYEELGEQFKLSSNSMVTEELTLCTIVDKLNKKYDELFLKEKALIKRENEINLVSRKNSEEKNKNLDLLDDIYDYCDSIIRSLFLQVELIKILGLKKIIELLNLFYEVGKLKGKDITEIENSILPELVDIYNVFGSYVDSYNYMLRMIKNSSWVLIRKETVIWSKKNNKFNEIKYEIEKRINENKSNTKEEWKKYLKEILKILEDK